MSDEYITPNGHRLSLAELDLSAIRASGSGGQNVNKVSSAIHLRFDIQASSLPESLKQGLLAQRDARINSAGILVIKAQNHRTQERNRREALQRLALLVDAAAQRPARRVPTRPSRAAKARRVDRKKQRGTLKKLRSRVDDG